MASAPASPARQLRESTAQRVEPEELGLVCRAFPTNQVQRMVRDGVITDAVTVACLGLLMLHGLL
ncbi:hypothetical protein [Pseudorhodoferax sp. Leaf267]|uniref:hypothetical protein n=1 Tax=Pseudorhodoferax sp. Leaf267 TaxID=1736316 RepID=UPI0012E2082E|nr:hypothetical protein [Pseudorhodoferax sp. Leaf267]